MFSSHILSQSDTQINNQTILQFYLAQYSSVIVVLSLLSIPVIYTMLAYMRTNNQISRQSNNQSNKQLNKLKAQPSANGQPTKPVKPQSADKPVDLAKPAVNHVAQHPIQDKPVTKSADAVVDAVSSQHDRPRKQSNDQSSSRPRKQSNEQSSNHLANPSAARSEPQINASQISQHQPVNQSTTQNNTPDESAVRRRKPKLKVNAKKIQQSIIQSNGNPADSSSVSTDTNPSSDQSNHLIGSTSPPSAHPTAKQASSQSSTSSNPSKPRHARQSNKQSNNKSSNHLSRPGRVAVRANSCDLPSRPLRPPSIVHLPNQSEPTATLSTAGLSLTQPINQSNSQSHSQSVDHRTCRTLIPEMECKEIELSHPPISSSCTINPPLTKRTLQIKQSNNQAIKSRSLNSSPVNRLSRTINQSNGRSNTQLLPKASPPPSSTEPSNCSNHQSNQQSSHHSIHQPNQQSSHSQNSQPVIRSTKTTSSTPLNNGESDIQAKQPAQPNQSNSRQKKNHRQRKQLELSLSKSLPQSTISSPTHSVEQSKSLLTDHPLESSVKQVASPLAVDLFPEAKLDVVLPPHEITQPSRQSSRQSSSQSIDQAINHLLSQPVSDSPIATVTRILTSRPSIDHSNNSSSQPNHRLTNQSIKQTINQTMYQSDLYHSPLSSFSLDSASTPSTPSTGQSINQSNDCSIDHHDSDSLSDDEFIDRPVSEPDLSINRSTSQSVNQTRHSDHLTYSIFGTHNSPRHHLSNHSSPTSLNQSIDPSSNHSPDSQSIRYAKPAHPPNDPSTSQSVSQTINPPTNQFSSLHHQILQVSRLMGPNAVDTIKRRQVLQRVATVIFNEWEPSLNQSHNQSTNQSHNDKSNTQSVHHSSGRSASPSVNDIECVEVHVIGSCATDLFLPDSDIDLVVRLPTRFSNQSINQSTNQPHSASSTSSQHSSIQPHSQSITQDLHSLGAALQSISSSIQIISTASVPLIKLIDQLTGFTVDLTLNIDTGLYSTSLVLRYLDLFDRQGIMNGFHGQLVAQSISQTINSIHANGVSSHIPPTHPSTSPLVNQSINPAVIQSLHQVHPILRPLTIVLKQFLKARGLNDLYSGGLPSYSLILMIVAFLQWQIRCKINERISQFTERPINHLSVNQLSHSLSSDRLTSQLNNRSEQRKRSSSQTERSTGHQSQHSPVVNEQQTSQPINQNHQSNSNHLNRTSVSTILQQPIDQSLGQLINDSSCPDLGLYLLAFLDFYGNHFPYNRVGISLLDPSMNHLTLSIDQSINQPINPGQVRFFHKASRGWFHPHAPHLLSLESPLDARSDVGFKVFRIAEVKAAFAQAFVMLSGGDEEAINLSVNTPPNNPAGTTSANETSNQSNSQATSQSINQPVNQPLNPSVGLTSAMTELILAAADFELESESSTPLTPMSASMTTPILPSMNHSNNQASNQAISQTISHLHARTMTPSPPLLHYPRSVPSSPHQSVSQPTNQPSYQHDHQIPRNRSYSMLKEEHSPSIIQAINQSINLHSHSPPVYNQHNQHSLPHHHLVSQSIHQPTNHTTSHSMPQPIPQSMNQSMNQYAPQQYYAPPYQYPNHQYPPGYYPSIQQIQPSIAPSMVPPYYPMHHSHSPVTMQYYQQPVHQSFTAHRSTSQKLNKMRPQRTQSQHQAYQPSHHSNSPSTNQIHQPRSAVSPRRKREHRQSDTDLPQTTQQQQT